MIHVSITQAQRLIHWQRSFDFKAVLLLSIRLLESSRDISQTGPDRKIAHQPLAHHHGQPHGIKQPAESTLTLEVQIGHQAIWYISILSVTRSTSA